MYQPLTIDEKFTNYGQNEKQRAIDIEKILSMITSPSDLQNSNTPQKNALDWIIHYDKRKLQSDSNHLIQRYILAVIYFSTGGNVLSKDNFWTVCGNLNFLSSVHECNWKYKHKKRLLGVISCNEDSYVTNLLLSGCKLQGSLPSEVGHLSTLETLTLSDNSFSGSIPSTIGNHMKSLEYLSLDSNRLSGIIPEELGNLPKIGKYSAAIFMYTGDFITHVLYKFFK